MNTIDLNADLGEGMTDDEALLDVVSSANIACGFHAGDTATMRRVCEGAARRGVRVGAHVSYRDREQFGRRDLEVEPDVLAAGILEQIDALASCGEVAYVKPHGALYNRIVHDERQARAVVAALKSWRRPLPLLGLPGARVLALGREAGLATIEEGFADRAYTSEGRLVPRSGPGAVIHDPAEAARRAVELARSGRVRSLCVHGDTPGAVAMARRVRAELEAAGMRISPFA
ncbi:MAG: LamB/YcsF family protein [Nevskiaceae bacterium]